ncbi:helix-turn-helix transcriptional regulator [Clostridium sp. 'deep sea']|uniref:helix-turn-helix domain-containing protein n=1 Tax=Clostridium sp. 'deep sea' TaxID=2779445 RepID=UPI00189674B0|nr:helix-turn-helix transcriptional regulator [Clostridium sp. 'deep sea']QOR33865.1 helix-turn-helix transcriptional regulator [Clostridium sp. 'deep sea']
MSKRGDLMFCGKRLKHLRLTNNMKQTQLADKLQISKGCISRYELGIRNPNLHTLLKMSVVFNVSTDYLLGRDLFVESILK